MKQSCRLRNCVVLASLEVEIGEEAPDPDREIAHQRLLDLAEPADELRQQPPRDAVGQQEIEVLLLENRRDPGSDCHGPVSPARINTDSMEFGAATFAWTALGAIALATALAA